MTVVPYEGSATQKKRAEKDQPSDYAPYCLRCSTMARMKEIEHGFICDPTYVEEVHPAARAIGIVGRRGCGNKINWDWYRLED